MDALDIIKDEKNYRKNQLYKAWFDLDIADYGDITTFPAALREKLKSCPWLSVKAVKIAISRKDNTQKALLELGDGLQIESVLMERGNRHTICVSSQAGCAMGCVFCATGKLGFKRNLKTAEIIDQLRFWQKYLAERNSGEVDNIVVMGQGEPLLNYENIKAALNIILDNTKIGPRKITLSTVGIKSGMEKMLEDKDFPPVRIAISLHSAMPQTRKNIAPSHWDGFLEFLPRWAKKYHSIFGSRSHFISLEYVMLSGVNDDDKHLKALIKLSSNLGNMRVNLIPLNSLADSPFACSPEEILKKWQAQLNAKGIICTIRHSQGADIYGACGQLALNS